MHMELKKFAADVLASPRDTQVRICFFQSVAIPLVRLVHIRGELFVEWINWGIHMTGDSVDVKDVH